MKAILAIIFCCVALAFGAFSATVPLASIVTQHHVIAMEESSCKVNGVCYNEVHFGK